MNSFSSLWDLPSVPSPDGEADEGSSTRCDDFSIRRISEIATEHDIPVVCTGTADAYAVHVGLSGGSYCADSEGYADWGSVAENGVRCATEVISTSVDLEYEADRQLNTAITFSLTNVNDVPTIELPADALSPEELAETIPLFSALSSARGSGEDAARKSTINTGRAMAEIYYDDNDNAYAGHCDAYLEDFRSSLPEAEFKCNDSEAAYAMAVLLNDGSHYCTDSTGFAGEIDTELGDRLSCRLPAAGSNP